MLRAIAEITGCLAAVLTFSLFIAICVGKLIAAGQSPDDAGDGGADRDSVNVDFVIHGGGRN